MYEQGSQEAPMISRVMGRVALLSSSLLILGCTSSTRVTPGEASVMSKERRPLVTETTQYKVRVPSYLRVIIKEPANATVQGRTGPSDPRPSSGN